MKHSIVLMTLLLTLAACGGGSGGSGGNKVNPPAKTEDPIKTEEPGDDTPSETKIIKVRKVELNKDFSNFEEYKQELNNWKVKIQDKSYSGNDFEVSCDNQKASFDKKGVAEVELSLKKDDPLKVEVHCKIADRGVEVDNLTLQLKKSILVSGKQNIIALSLSDSSSIETLVLEKDALLVTDGRNVNLTMNELISNGGTIATFDGSLPYSPQPNEAGKSGGVINIVTQKAHGDIVIELRGLAAGIQTATQGPQLVIPATGSEYNGLRQYECKPGKGNGKQGPQGLRGHQGHPGFKGGDAGLLLFRSFGKNTLKMTVKPLPGNGGAGGAGGKGGAGGAGGKGGSWSAQGAGGTCKDGPQGGPGPDGEQGKPGAIGNIPTSSVSYENENKYYDVMSTETIN